MTTPSKISEAVILGLVGAGIVEGAKAVGDDATGRSEPAALRSGQVTFAVVGALGGVLAALSGHSHLFVTVVLVSLSVIGLYELLRRRATGRG